MELLKLCVLLINLSVLVLVFSIGAQADVSDVTYLWRKPALLLKSILSTGLIFPIFVVVLVMLFDLKTPVKIALVLLAISPVPPILPRKQIKVGGRESFAVSLLVTRALLAILLVPTSVELVGRVFKLYLQVPSTSVAKVILLTVLLPLGAGLGFRYLAPSIAGKLASAFSAIGGIVLLVAALPLLVVLWPLMTPLIGDGTLLAIAVANALGLLAGHLLGGPNPEDRVVLSIATAARHPGVALAIASASFTGQKLVPAAIILYLLVNAIVSIPYVQWTKRHMHVGGKTATVQSK